MKKLITLLAIILSATAYGQITCATPICNGSTTSASDIRDLGKWLTSNTTLCPIDSITGVVRGLGTGMFWLYYQYNHVDTSGSFPDNYCIATTPWLDSFRITISGTVAGISYGGSVVTSLSLPVGHAPITLTETASGHTWISDNPGIAAVVTWTSGLHITTPLSFVSAGTTHIRYYANNGCPSPDVVVTAY